MRKRVIDLIEGEYYSYSKKEGFTEYNPLDFKYNGFDIKSLYQHYLHKLDILKEYEDTYKQIKEWLENNGMSVSSKKLKDLVSEMKDKIEIFNREDNFEFFEMDQDGYIIGYKRLDNGLLNNFLIDFIPNDLTKGYYKVVDNKIVKDLERESEVWSF